MQTRQSSRGPKQLSGNKIVALPVCLLVCLFVPAVCLGQSTPVEPDQLETVRVESDLVDLKVSVVSLNPQHPSPELLQKDFLVFEDGKPQDISFFAAADAPFDLVLLLDLSASTNNKLKLIRSSAKRFVEATRPTDRVAVVVFTDVATVVSPLTQDRKLLKKSIDDMEKPGGGTRFWDSLRAVLAILDASHNPLRRSAVVVMTDGVDNALPDVLGPGSQTGFDQLVGIVRASEAIVFPIYLDTEPEVVKRHLASRETYAMARDQLARLAEASGSRLYRANKVKDLDDVYQQVIGDLGRIYSIGYRPSNTLRDGKWRAVNVQIQGQQEVTARTKVGYFSKTLPN